MNKSIKWFLGILIAALSFLANPHGPLGGFWRPDSMAPDPTSLQLPFLILLKILESATFAFAVVLLIFRMPKKPLPPLTLPQTRRAFVCLIWLFGNWWAHDSLHIHIGMNLQNLLYLEYGFHVTLMASALYLLWIANKFWQSQK